MECVNCGLPVVGKFCPECGQRTGVKRINLKEGWHDFWSRVYGFDGMFPRTLRDLTLRPGKVALSYIRRNRVKYYGPVGYFFLMITVCLLLLSLIGVDYFDYMRGMQERFVIPSTAKSTATMTRLISDNLKIFAFLSIPFQALTARFIFFRKTGLNFLEHMVLPFYTSGHLYWLITLLGAWFAITHYSFAGVTALAMIPYVGFAYVGLDEHASHRGAFFRGVANYLLGQVLFVITVMLILLLSLPLIQQFAPEFYESMRPSAK